MTAKVCPKCNFENEGFRGVPMEACPSCHAIYEKAELAMVRQADEESRRAAQEEKERYKAAIRSEQVGYREAKQKKKAIGPGSHICATCGSSGRPKRNAKGSFAVEVTIWLVGLATVFFGIGFIILLGALIYSIWRMFGGKTRVCRSCGSAEVIPGDSPRGRELLERHGYLD